MTEGKRATSRRVGEAEMQSHQKPTPSTATHNLEGSHNTELLPEEWGHQAPHPWGLCREMSPKTPGFENKGACVQETGNWDSSLKGLEHRLAQEPSTKAEVWKAPKLYVKEIHLLILKCLLKGQGPDGTLSRDGGTVGYHFCAPPLPC